MSRLQGKVAIVTGAARGMGAATARLFAEEGARVVLTDVLSDDGQRLAATIGKNARFVRHDVSDEAEWQSVLEQTVASFGPVDILVNNAGVLAFKTLAETSKADFQRIIDINLIGTFLGLKLIGAHMADRRSGSIVNVSSADGMKSANGLGAYSASKWGIRGLTRTAAMEYGHQGVRVNSVHPGGIDTAMANPQGTARTELNQRFSMVPLQRVGDPMEVARTSLFLASDDASYLCGAEIAVDGGMLAGQYYEGLPGAPAR